MLQANSAGRVRLNLIIRIGDSFDLESQEGDPPPDSSREKFGGSGENYFPPNQNILCSEGFPGRIFSVPPKHKNWCLGEFRLLPWTVSACSGGFKLEPPNKLSYLFCSPPLTFPGSPELFPGGVRGSITLLESHEILSPFLRSYLEDYTRICRKKSRTYSKLDLKRNVQNSPLKHVTCPGYVIYWKIPQMILRSKFSYLTTGKYQKDGHLEISRFLKSMFLYLALGDL